LTGAAAGFSYRQLATKRDIEKLAYKMDKELTLFKWMMGALKAGYYGVYHYMSHKHLHRYVNEFAFRHSTAKIGTIEFIDSTVSRMNNQRLTNKELTAYA
jgi:hypothetical protein